MNEQQTCDWCEQQWIVRVNEHWACPDHIDNAMSMAFTALREVREVLRDER